MQIEDMSISGLKEYLNNNYMYKNFYLVRNK